ncbi:hypothetical protein BJX62DRAFT_240313 [Aspergillus germanicus]
MRPWIPQIKNARQGVLAGFLGPIGVSAVFYLFIALDFIEAHLSAGQGNPGGPRTDVVDLAQTLRTVVWFLVVCSHQRSRRPTRQSFLYGASTLSRVLSISLSEEIRVRVPAAVFPRIRIPVLPKPLDAKLGDIKSTHVRHTQSVEEARDASADTHHGLPDVDLLVDVT